MEALPDPILLLIPPFQTIDYRSTLLWDVTSVAEGHGTTLSRRSASGRPSQVVRFECVEAVPGRADDEPRDLGVPVQLLQVVLPLDAHHPTPSQHGTQHQQRRGRGGAARWPYDGGWWPTQLRGELSWASTHGSVSIRRLPM